MHFSHDLPPIFVVFLINFIKYIKGKPSWAEALLPLFFRIKLISNGFANECRNSYQIFLYHNFGVASDTDNSGKFLNINYI